MKTTLQVLCLLLFVVLFHIVVISSFGLLVWAGMAIAALGVMAWLFMGASYARA